MQGEEKFIRWRFWRLGGRLWEWRGWGQWRWSFLLKQTNFERGGERLCPGARKVNSTGWTCSSQRWCCNQAGFGDTKKELEIMKWELTLTSRRHSARAHSSDEEDDGIDEKLIAMRRPSLHNSQMMAKRRATNKACREQFEERAREGIPRFWWILIITVHAYQTIIFSTFFRCFLGMIN